MADARSRLVAIAAGKAVEAQPSDHVVDEKVVEKLQPDFRPWESFASHSLARHGERLTAPAEILIPLP